MNSGGCGLVDEALLLLGMAIIAAPITIYFCCVAPKKLDAEFKKARQYALVQHADTDRDGNVSRTEENAFDAGFKQYVSSQTGASYQDGHFSTKNGEPVTKRELVQFMKAYTP